MKFSGSMDALNYDIAYYHQDDFGSTSTDTVDDNRHWGSSTTYRKVQTFVGNLGYTFADAHKLGVSLQAGQLQDFTTADNDVDGDHDAFVLYYKGAYSNDMYLNAEFISANRDLPKSYAASAGLNTDTETTRWAFEVGHSVGDWTYYLDVTGADTDTTGNASDSITAFAPGVKYDYGPGWIYAEYLDQNGYIDRNGDVVDNSDFEALYLTIDWYF